MKTENLAILGFSIFVVYYFFMKKDKTEESRYKGKTKIVKSPLKFRQRWVPIPRGRRKPPNPPVDPWILDKDGYFRLGVRGIGQHKRNVG